MIEPVEVDIGDVAYVVRPPTGLDWIETAELGDFERTVSLIQRCVTIDGRQAFQSYDEAARQELPLLLNLERVLSRLLEYDIPDPLSAPSEPPDGLSISA